MRASFLDLRNKSREILQALDRSERITIFYRGRPKAVLHPFHEQNEGGPPKAQDHPAFGMWKDRQDLAEVDQHVRRLRKGRVGDL